MIKYSYTRLVAIIGLLFLMGITSAWSSDTGGHKQTKHYNIYLGVVPAAYIKKNPVVIDGAKDLHGGVDNSDGLSVHVMVAVFNKSDNSRVLNATIIAEIRRKKLMGSRKVEKPLEKMLTSGTVTYGNYFDMLRGPGYRIRLKIYEPNKSFSERVDFVYTRP